MRRGPPVEESVYALVPPEVEVPAKPPMHRSRFAAQARDHAAPTYSTFASRRAGAGKDSSGQGLFSKPAASMGRVTRFDDEPSGGYLRSHTGNAGEHLAQAASFDRPLVKPVKDAVPAPRDKPVMGLMSDKNFIHSNAVEMMTAPPRHKPSMADDLPATQRPSFGQPPKYLTRVKESLEAERELSAALKADRDDEGRRQREQYAKPLDAAEKERLVAALRDKWELKHRQFQAMPIAHSGAMQVARREAAEKELKEMERHMAKLSKDVVLVFEDRHGPMVSGYAKALATQGAEATAREKVKESTFAKKTAAGRR